MGRPSHGCAGRALRALLGVAISGKRARAWVAEGHLRIADVAEHLIEGSRGERIHAMFEGGLEKFADWEQTMSAAHPETAALQWHLQEPEWNCSGMIGEHGHINCNSHGAANSSLYCAALYFFEQLSDAALMKHDPRPRQLIPAPKHLEALGDLELDTAQRLRWLVALVGDMHQPLHWLREHRYGKDVQLTYQGKTYSLLDFWEEYIPKQLQKRTNFQNIKRIFHKNQEFYFQRSPSVHFQNWARDAATALCSRIYAPMMAEGEVKGQEEPFLLEEQLYKEWMSLADELTVVAGQHVAALLLDLLRHSQHRAAYKEGRTQWHPWHLRDPSGFVHNALIAIPVVPGMLGLLLLHERLVSGKGRPSCLPSTHLKA